MTRRKKTNGNGRRKIMSPKHFSQVFKNLKKKLHEPGDALNKATELLGHLLNYENSCRHDLQRFVLKNAPRDGRGVRNPLNTTTKQVVEEKLKVLKADVSNRQSLKAANRTLTRTIASIRDQHGKKAAEYVYARILFDK